MDRDVYLRMDALQNDHWWFTSRRKILGTVFKREIPVDANILEAGCGTGGNLKLLSGYGNVTGFEHDKEALELAREKGNYALSQGSLPDGAPAYEHPFDTIVALDVIEHVEQDVESLKTLRTMLKPGGKIIITVPAFSFLWSRHDETHHHFRRYTKAQLSEVLFQSGFTVEKSSYFNSILFPPIATVRLLQKLFGAKGEGDDTMPSKPINAFLAAVFSSERFWVGRIKIPFGVSLIAIAKSP